MKKTRTLKSIFKDIHIENYHIINCPFCGRFVMMNNYNDGVCLNFKSCAARRYKAVYFCYYSINFTYNKNNKNEQ